MAIYHCSIKIISRGKGKSAVAAAAYRAGEKITNEYDAVTHDYTRKGGIVHTEILLPEHAPPEYKDRSILWNAVEWIEKNKNSQLAREIELALPKELTEKQNITLVRQYVKKNFVDKGMCADVCIHDTNGENPHAHVLLTMRPFEQDGSWGAKSKKEYILDGNGERIILISGEFKSRKISTTDWDNQENAEVWRAEWATAVNSYLKHCEHPARIDHRSFERQGKDEIPSVHLGVAAHQMERRGIRTERGNMNREIGVANIEIRQLNARIKKSKNWLYAQPIANAPTMVDVMKGVAGAKNLRTQKQKLRNLQTMAKALVFVQNNGIRDIEQLAKKIEDIHEQFYEVSNKIKSTNRRIDMVTLHLAQWDIYKQNKKFHKKYNELKGKKSDAFYDKYFSEIQDFEQARDYFKAVMNGKPFSSDTVKAWEKEVSTLTAKKFELCDEFYRLKDEVKNAETLRRGAENIMKEHEQPQRSRAQEIDI